MGMDRTRLAAKRVESWVRSEDMVYWRVNSEATAGPWLKTVADASGDAGERWYAIRKLGAIRATEAVPLLIELLEKSDKSHIRNAAIYALADIGDFGAVQPLANAVRDEGCDATTLEYWNTVNDARSGFGPGSGPIPAAMAFTMNGINAIQALGWFRGSALARTTLWSCGTR
jgi:HEAT repeat protein